MRSGGEARRRRRGRGAAARSLPLAPGRAGRRRARRRRRGATAKADVDAVNLAAPLADGVQVLVPARGAAGAGAAGGAARRRRRRSTSTRRPLEQLDALPGIGPSTAQKIVDYRQAHGAFHSLEELDAVPGIGAGRIAQLKGLVVPVMRDVLSSTVRRSPPGLRLAVAAPFALLPALAVAIAVACVDARLALACLARRRAAGGGGAQRLHALDRSVLAREVGTAGRCRRRRAVEPPRRGRFDVHVRAVVVRWRGERMHEPCC